MQLSRFDRPAGFYLLALPCLIGLALARMSSTGFEAGDLRLGLLFVVGAVAMRGAGCTYNDILDRDIDARVARTAMRPLPAGAVSLKSAWSWLALQCAVGLAVLLFLPLPAQLVSVAALPLVALYPLMKRITWWPQAWLGLTFNWGVLVAGAATGHLSNPAILLLYGALALWTLGYDTIYALQDREDDALVGVRSTARRFGGAVQPAVACIYALCVGLAALAGWLAAGWAGAAAIFPFAGHLASQAYWVRPDKADRALVLFRSNTQAGIVLLACWAFVAAFISPINA